ncbi:hemin uptake protein HemP [Geobacter sulfurreducens]|uniref:hemin uptake protein HemP n=1 Tax=Geobacter sulfurreducens TaxID=35554 RepID=UPI001EE63BE5|nr:hemin uptake protein HemP [Geobacter sulfurreducens]
MRLAMQRQNDGQGQASEREKECSRRIVTSRELMGNAKEVIIEHAGEEYRLRITRQQKLILTK